MVKQSNNNNGVCLRCSGPMEFLCEGSSSHSGGENIYISGFELTF